VATVELSPNSDTEKSFQIKHLRRSAGHAVALARRFWAQNDRLPQGGAGTPMQVIDSQGVFGLA